MTAIFAMQAYWLYNQYEYSSMVKAEELKQACTKALEEEKDIRLDKQEDNKDDSSYVRMQIVLKIDQSTKKTKEKDRNSDMLCHTDIQVGLRRTEQTA